MSKKQAITISGPEDESFTITNVTSVTRTAKQLTVTTVTGQEHFWPMDRVNSYHVISMKERKRLDRALVEQQAALPKRYAERNAKEKAASDLLEAEEAAWTRGANYAVQQSRRSRRNRTYLKVNPFTAHGPVWRERHGLSR